MLPGMLSSRYTLQKVAPSFGADFFVPDAIWYEKHRRRKSTWTTQKIDDDIAEKNKQQTIKSQNYTKK